MVIWTGFSGAKASTGSRVFSVLGGGCAGCVWAGAGLGSHSRCLHPLTLLCPLSTPSRWMTDSVPMWHVPRLSSSSFALSRSPSCPSKYPFSRVPSSGSREGGVDGEVI